MPWPGATVLAPKADGTRSVPATLLAAPRPYKPFLELQERLTDIEAVLTLRTAKRAEGQKRWIPLSEVKRRLRQQ